MKKILIAHALLLVVLVGGTPLMAQDDAVERYYSEYENDDRFTSVTVSSKMFNLFTQLDVDKEEDQKILETIGKLAGLRVITSDSIDNGMALFNAARKKPSSEYEELMNVKKSGEQLVFLIREKGGKIHELLMLAGKSHRLIIMSIVGDIDLKSLSSLSKNVNIGGLHYLENID